MLLFLISCSLAVVDPQGTLDLAAKGEAEGEALSRRACKFRPLPRNLDEGYVAADGSIHVAENFGLPYAALLGGGHVITGKAPENLAELGLAVQVPFSASSSLLVILNTAGGKSQTCVKTWGAGGMQKQCSFAGVQLPSGEFTLTFRIKGHGIGSSLEGSGGPAACLTLRLDMDVIGQAAAKDCRSCPSGATQLPSTTSPQEKVLSVALGSFKAPPSNGVIWNIKLPVSKGDTSRMLMRLYARMSFKSMVNPLRFLIEELESAEATRTVPLCNRRCFGGTPLTHGQVLQRLMPPGQATMLWILAQDGQHIDVNCVVFDFELHASLVKANTIQENFLGPPAWLCEGGAWPARLEQLPKGQEPVVVASDDSERSTLRSQKFALRDVFDLTRPPSQQLGQTGSSVLHSLEIKVLDWSAFRLTTHFATVQARPVLIFGIGDEAWQKLGTNFEIPTFRIPISGGEFRHGINAELAPGDYTLFFVIDMPFGGLRPCASVLVHLALDPWDMTTAGPVTDGPCTNDVTMTMLDLQAMAEPVLMNSLVERSTDYKITLPRPESAPQVGPQVVGTVGSAEVFARSTVKLSSWPTDGTPLMLRARVISPFADADIQVMILEDGDPLGEPHPTADGSGYFLLAGPLTQGRNYEVVLLHVPRKPAGGPRPQSCVTFSFEFTPVILTPTVTTLKQIASGTYSSGMPAVLPLPGASTCWLAAHSLPKEVVVREGWPRILEGEFLLPPLGQHLINIRAPVEGTEVVLRVIVSSADAEVRLAQVDPVLNGLAEDMFFISGRAGVDVQAVTIKVARMLTQTSCPKMKLHLVLMRVADLPACPSTGLLTGLAVGGSSTTLAQKLVKALVEQNADTANLQFASTVLPTKDDVGNGFATFMVNSATVEFRLELLIEPPWLPLEVLLQRAGDEEQVWARARASGQRLVLLLPSLPQGTYTLQLRNPAAGATLPAGRCALVSGSAALLSAAGRDTSNYRQEMLDLAELLAVSELPGQLIPEWATESDSFLFSHLYSIPARSGALTALHLKAPSILRLVAEPANILSPRLGISMKKGATASDWLDQQLPSSSVTGWAVRLPAGVYQMTLTPIDGAQCPSGSACPVEKVPFFMTVGISKDSGSASSPATCEGSMPAVAVAAGKTASNWLWRKELQVGSLKQSLALPLNVPRPSVVMIAGWSPFTDHFVRVALRTQEGLWVGEQRSRLSSLEIELPPGDYQMVVEEPAPLFPNTPGCFSLGIAVSLSPFTSVPSAASIPPVVAFGEVHSAGASSDGSMLLSPSITAGPGLGLGASCDGLGALPLPLDVISIGGGSTSYGGPIDANGRLLIRERILLTDIHDGRKKLFLRIAPGSLLRVAMVSGDADSVEAILEAGNHAPIAPTMSHILGPASGQAFSYASIQGGDMWLSFHREHRVANGAGCASFQLLLQLANAQDAKAMSDCGKSVMTLKDLTHAVELSLGANSPVAAAEGRVSISDSSQNTVLMTLALSEPSFVEVELQFNFLLSNVHLWIEASHAELRDSSGPTIGPAGLASSPLNAHAVLQLRLPQGGHALRVHHESAFATSNNVLFPGGPCAPLRLVIRKTPLNTLGTIVTPSLMAPVSFGSDIVVVAMTPNGFPPKIPTIGTEKPRASSIIDSAQAISGGVAVAWASDALIEAAKRGEGKKVEVSVANIRALPLKFGDEIDDSGTAEVWIVIEPTGTGTPWSGQDSTLFVGPNRPWPKASANQVPATIQAGLPTLQSLPTLPPFMLSTLSKDTSQQVHGTITTSSVCWLIVIIIVLYVTCYRHYPQLLHMIEGSASKFGRPGKAAAAVLGEMASMVEFTSMKEGSRGSGVRLRADGSNEGRLYGSIR